MKERSLQDQQWLEQKKINRETNLALLEGWDGGVYRKAIMARRVFRKRQLREEQIIQKYAR